MAATLNLTVPKAWTDLSQCQLRFLLQTMVDVQLANKHVGFSSVDDYAAQTAAQVNTLCLIRWTGLRVICPYADGWLVAFNGDEYCITAGQVAAALSPLAWTKELPEYPVRLSPVDGAEAVAADLSSDFSFDNWLSCETLWQAYQIAPDDALLRHMAEILYRKEDIHLDAAETLGIFYWWAAVKSMVSAMFPDFFKPSDNNTDAPSSDDMRRSMDAQIRALTKGDITKEKEILAMDAMRALTELDAQAREYYELNKKYPSK